MATSRWNNHYISNLSETISNGPKSEINFSLGIAPARVGTWFWGRICKCQAVTLLLGYSKQTCHAATTRLTTWRLWASLIWRRAGETTNTLVISQKLSRMARNWDNFLLGIAPARLGDLILRKDMEMPCQKINMGGFQANVSCRNDAFDDLEAMSFPHMATSRWNNNHISTMNFQINDHARLIFPSSFSTPIAPYSGLIVYWNLSFSTSDRD